MRHVRVDRFSFDSHRVKQPRKNFAISHYRRLSAPPAASTTSTKRFPRIPLTDLAPLGDFIEFRRSPQ